VPGSIVAVPAVPPASLAGQTVLTGFQPQELTFICGKHLSYYRGEHYIRTLFPTQAELTIMLFAGVMIAAPNTPCPGLQARIRATRKNSRSTCSRCSSKISIVVKSSSTRAQPTSSWNQAVEQTACRAGLLAARISDRQEDHRQADARPHAQEKSDLLLWRGESYAQLRKALGIAVG
jgi:hypothetical protein